MALHMRSQRLEAQSSRPKQAMDDDVKALVEAHEFLQVVETGEGDDKKIRIKCDLTQHEMLPRKDVVETHLNSKKFKKAKEWYCYDYSQYEPYIVAHRRKPKCLYCNVTDKVLNRIPAEVEKHVKGKRFLRLKEHVKFETKEDVDDNEFDANRFEFEHRQVVYSDEEDGDGEGGDEEEDEEEIDDDMKDLYPSEDDSDGEAHFNHNKTGDNSSKKRKKSSKKEEEEEEEEEPEKEEGDDNEDAAKPEEEEAAKEAEVPAPKPKRPNGNRRQVQRGKQNKRRRLEQMKK
ncbi:TPA: hypothetical protein N0F65_005115 [Lagenidium giganteum]|uniref:Surfeit locus protein 2 n=1 Tax=Lagenidium giganteum TaxID=4803 RepID=A0AAV2Z6G9_9STRA|nr:TPA: hypothetical protein N0F65_005115 [Lagenidium giganteum]